MRMVNVWALVDVFRLAEVDIVIRERGANIVSFRAAMSGIQSDLLVL